MQFKTYHSALYTAKELAGLEAVLAQSVQHPGTIGALVADHDGILIASLMPEEVAVDAVVAPIVEAIKTNPDAPMTEIYTEQGYVLVADFGGGLFASLFEHDAYEKEKAQQAN